MAIAWFIAPYKQAKSGPKDIQYCAVEDFYPDIRDSDGDWIATEIDGGKAIVRVRASDSVLSKISNGTDVEIIRIEDPYEYWKPTATINGRIFNVQSVETMMKYLLDDKNWGDMKYRAEKIINQLNKTPHIKISKGDWRLTAQLLEYLGRNGFGLNKVSTGTFPTTGVIDSFDRANATTLGANWSILYTFTGVTNWGITGNLGYNPDADGYSAQYYNAATYGPDCEAYVTLTTKTPDSTNDGTNIYARAKEPGTNFDGYSIELNHATSPTQIQIYRWADHVASPLGSPVNQAISSGDKLGIEVIGFVISAYLYTGGSWSLIKTETDGTSAYPDAGYLGLYLTGIPAGEVWRIDDFSGGTIIAGSPTIDQEGYRFRYDNGDEAAATWAEAQDAVITAPKNVNKRLRFVLNGVNDPTSKQFQLEYKKSTEGTYKKVT